MKLYYPEGMKFHALNAIKHLDFEPYSHTDKELPAMFWCYFEEDYEFMLDHKGKKVIFWHGSDVLRLKYGYIDKDGIKRYLKQYLRPMHEQEIIHVCHSDMLQDELARLGIYALVRPTFWGDISKYKPRYEYSETPEIYMSSNPGREIEYGEGYMIALSKVFPDCRFHVYGNEGYSTDNLFFHGRIPEDQMDSEIKDMQICLRMNEHDGVSQTVMKALLMNQFVITKIEYHGIRNAPDFRMLKAWIESYVMDDILTEYNYATERFNNFDYK